MDNRRLAVFIVLSVAILAIWQYFFPSPAQRARIAAPPGASATGSAAGSGAVPAASSPPNGSGTPVPTAGGPAGVAGATGAAGGAPQAPAAPPIAGQQEERVTLRGRNVEAQLTSRGAQLVSWVVQEPGAAGVELVRKRSHEPYPFALLDKRLQPAAIDAALFTVERSTDERGVTFRYRGGEGSAEKSFRFDDRGFLTVQVKASGAWSLLLGPGIGNPTAAELDNRYGKRGAVVKAGGDVQALSPKGETEAKTFSGRGLSWVGLEDTYFAAVAVPQGGSVARAVLQPVLVEPDADGARFVPVPPKDDLTKEQKDFSREYLVALEPADPLNGSVTLECYFGGKNYEKLAALPYGLEETVNLGMLRLVARPLLAGLHWIYEHIVANYGWAIIVMTVAIKLLLLPLTHHSTMSMRKMQVLNPKMQAIRDRYRTKLKDKQGRPNLEMQRKMNEEVMGLYKAEGVNPAGGCLPLVLQMPILFAFYRLLSNSIELRHAPWMFWIHDLSVQDPYFILPLIMGATQFLQVYLAPQSGDPSQRRLFLLMPVFMLVFFFAAPSGLVLYWLTNNVLTIAQQAVYNRFWKLESAT